MQHNRGVLARLAGTPRPWAFAHRGDSVHHRENTLGAFRAAVAAGADGIETDVRLTTDGVPVLLHDASLTRTAGIRRRLERLTLAGVEREEKARGTAPGERVATLTGALASLPAGFPVLLELKVDRPAPPGDGRLAAAVVELAAGHAGVTMISFDPWTLRQVRALDPEAPLGVLASHRLTPDPVELLGELAASLILLPVSHAPRTTVSRLQDQGLTVLLYTADGPVLERALAAGADGVLGNDARALVGRLRRARRQTTG